MVGKVLEGVTDTDGGGPYYAYINAEGLVKVIASEGVSYCISEDGFFTGYYMGEKTKISYAQLKEAAERGPQSDVADVIRVFGDRLEANHYLAYHDIKGD